LGGFMAPNLKRWVETTFDSTAAGLYFLAGASHLAALLILAVHRFSPAAPTTRAASFDTLQGDVHKHAHH